MLLQWLSSPSRQSLRSPLMLPLVHRSKPSFPRSTPSIRFFIKVAATIHPLFVAAREEKEVDAVARGDVAAGSYLSFIPDNKCFHCQKRVS